jgi:cyclohexanecarboxylate-CoA ligase
VSNDDTLEGLLAQQHGVVVDDDRRVADLAVRVAGVATGLRDAGVRRGDAVAFQLDNSIEAIVLYRACWRLGAVAVALHHRFGIAERESLVRQVDAALTITSADDVAALTRGEGYEPIDARPDDDAVVLFTAGSTGKPKGVRHTHSSLAYKTRLMIGVHELASTDVVLMPAPLAHISGLLNGVLVAGAAGMTTVLMPRWSAATALDLIEREQVSFMIGPPTFFVDLMDDPTFAPERVTSIRLISSGGAGVAPSFVRRAAAEFGAVVKRSYGSTEAPTVATSRASDDADHRAEYDGRAVGDAELRLVDGELWVRGPELFAGYLDDEQTAAVVTNDGWFRTGDLATITDDGWLRIEGRLKEIVIRAGENVSIREVEQLLEAHPDVRQAAAVGVPHERLGEQVAAVVVGELTVDECRRWFDRNGVAPFKTPEIVVVVAALPLTGTGKVDREQLKLLLPPQPA